MMKKELDTVYDPAHGLTFDLYESEHVAGTVIDIHGGGWFRGDKSSDADWAESLTKAGYRVVVPNYRITTVGGFYPAPLDDMHTLMGYLKSNGLIESGHVAAVGGSAGGNLAVELGIAYGIPVVSLSGILDIDDWLAAHGDVVPKESNNTQFDHKASAEIDQDGANDAFYKWFVVNYFNGRVDEYTAATPSNHVTDATGPMYLANSLNEFVPMSGVLDMGRALSAHQIPFTIRALPGTAHAKGYLPLVEADVLAFLERYVQPSAGLSA